ncbi:MAG: beta-ketoacyl-ACP reductase [Thermoplasmata archaeon]|nr:MAG: beta-ketoacyl-ACP reductase [Thermoplasmata archaeon]
MTGLKGKTAVVTGSSRGIGRACALELAGEGAVVAVNYEKNKDKARETVTLIDELGGEAVVIPADVSSPEEVEKMKNKIHDFVGPVDILVNNAGIHQHLKSWELSFKDWNRVLGVNLSGVFNCSKAFAPDMMERKWGRIVNISSVIAYIGTDHEVHYAASKGGVVSVTKSLALELAPYSITVNAVSPGYIETDMTTFSSEEEKKFYIGKIPLGRLGQPKDIAHAVVFLCSDSATYITGETIHVNGGLAFC